jgi:hypothetical protein
LAAHDANKSIAHKMVAIRLIIIVISCKVNSNQEKDPRKSVSKEKK